MYVCVCTCVLYFTLLADAAVQFNTLFADPNMKSRMCMYVCVWICVLYFTLLADAAAQFNNTTHTHRVHAVAIAKSLSQTAAAERQTEHFWPELLHTLWQCVQDTDPLHKESALFIFSVVPSLFGSELANYVNEIRGMLLASLHDTAHLNVKLYPLLVVVVFNVRACVIPRTLSELDPIVRRSMIVVTRCSSFFFFF
jgi:hypothetical protein